MLTLLKTLLFDPKAFIQAYTTAESRARTLLAFVGGLLYTGMLNPWQISDWLGLHLGKTGYIVGGVMTLLAILVASGDRTTPELKSLGEFLREANKPKVLTDVPPTSASAVKESENEKPAGS